LILSPGQTAILHVTFSPQAAGNSSGSLTVASNATNSPATISLSGVGTQTSLSSHSVDVIWSPTTSVVSGYNVYRSTVSGGPYAKVDPALLATDTYTDTAVQAGQTYFYVVTSVSADGVESADSTQVSATVPTP
jgi:fibronectin type 3 domain-containing protein